MSATITGTTLTSGATLVTGALITWPVSKKLAVLRALTTHIEGITRANGYEYDMGPVLQDDGSTLRKVYRGRAVFGDDTPAPCISILEGPTPDAAPKEAALNGIKRVDDWVIYIQGWVENADEHPTDTCYQLLACVEKRLSEIVSTRVSGMPTNPAAYMLGGAISAFTFTPGVVRPPQDQVSIKPFFYLPVVIQLPVDVTQPFVAA